MIRLNCFLKVKDGKKEELLEAAKRLTEASLKQEGCIAYDIFESATRSDVLMFCETWKDEVALKNHSESDVFKKEVAIITACAEMKLEQFDFQSK